MIHILQGAPSRGATVGKTGKTGFGGYRTKSFSFKIPFITVGLV